VPPVPLLPPLLDDPALTTLHPSSPSDTDDTDTAT
jgi:hypothetical protein